MVNTKTYKADEAMGAPKNKMETQANEKIKQEIDEYLMNAMDLLHSEKTRDAMYDMILSKPDPVESISDTVVLIFNRIDSSISKAGTPVSDTARLASSYEITNQVIELATAGGDLEEPSEEDRALVLSVSVEKYIKGEIKAGRMDKDKLAQEVDQMVKVMDPEERDAMIQGMESINNSVRERAGKIPSNSPYLSRKREQGQQQGQQQEQQQVQVPQQAPQGALGGM